MQRRKGGPDGRLGDSPNLPLGLRLILCHNTAIADLSCTAAPGADHAATLALPAHRRLLAGDDLLAAVDRSAARADAGPTAALHHRPARRRRRRSAAHRVDR